MESEVTAAGIPADKASWDAARAKGIGGSEIGTIIGVNPWQTPTDLWLRKTGRVDASAEETPALHWGHVLEDVVAQEWAARTGATLSEGIALSNGKHCRGFTDRMAVMPDGSKMLLECKTANARNASEWGPDDSFAQAPASYLAQVQFYLSMLPPEYRQADIAVLIGGQDFRVIHVERDDVIGASLQAAAERFWAENIEADVPPKAQDASERKTLVEALHRRDDGEMLTATADVERMMDDLEIAMANADEWEKKVTAVKARLMEVIGDASGVEGVGGRKATWRAQERRTLDSKAVKRLLTAEQIAACERVSKSRVFRFSKAKEADQ